MRFRQDRIPWPASDVEVPIFDSQSDLSVSGVLRSGLPKSPESGPSAPSWMPPAPRRPRGKGRPLSGRPTQVEDADLYLKRRKMERKVADSVRAFSRSAGFGLGEEVDDGSDDNPLASLADKPEFKEAREKLTPWLWVFSVFGFGMALLNTWRIKRIFKSWKGARQYARDAD